MSDAWGTPQEHNKDVEAQIAREQGRTITTETTTETDETTEDSMKFDKPTVVLPDGTHVAVEEYDPYKTERDSIIQEKGRVEGLWSALEKRTQAPEGTSEGDPEPEKKPLFNPIEFNEEEQVIGETDKVLASGLNNLGHVFTEMQSGNEEKITEIADNVNKLVKVVNNRFLEDELDKVSARTGFTREELIQANDETGIDSPEQVATYLRGKAAEEEAAQKAEEDAAKERRSKASGINGTSSGGEGTGIGNPNERPKIDYTNPVEVGKHFNFSPVAE